MVVLVADDSPLYRKIVGQILADAGFEVHYAENGVEAVTAAYSLAPDLILLDIMMPKMNGYQACRLLKDDQQTSEIPIIMLTAQEHKQDRFWGLMTGADKYLIKSFELRNTLFKEVQDTLAEWPVSESFKVALRATPKMTEGEIIERINSLLDQKLFESTLINEVNKLANSIIDYHQLIKEVMDMINEVLNFHTAALMLVDENSCDLVIQSVIAEERIKEDMGQLLMAEYAKQEAHSGELQVEQFSYFEIDGGTAVVTQIGDYPSIQIRPLYARSCLIGIFYLAHEEDSYYGKELLSSFDIITNQTSIVLDNAMLYKKIQQLAITDGLTKVFNHRFFQSQLQKELFRANRFGHNVSMIMIDIDHFKHFNDTYGHQEGDNVLRELAGALKSNLRSNVEIVSRYGGEEFVIILPETTKRSALIVAERIRAHVDNFPFSTKERYPEEQITISLGVSSYPEDADEQEALIKCADGHLYEAKENGRNRVCPAVS